MQDLVDSLNRTAKLALDDGRAASIEAAYSLFESFALNVQVGPGVAAAPALQAAFLTAVNAGARTFRGGIYVTGELDARLNIGWFAGQTVREAAVSLGGKVSACKPGVPWLGVGVLPATSNEGFALGIACNRWQFVLSPDLAAQDCGGAHVLVGVAAAGAALAEAFQYVYYGRAWAGRRHIEFDLLQAHLLPVLSPAPEFWVIGLGHVGQALLWGLGLVYGHGGPRVILQDDDRVTESSLSTCLLVSPADVNKLKTDAVSHRLAELGWGTEQRNSYFTPATRRGSDEPDFGVIAVDNVATRRCLDTCGFSRMVEGGIGHTAADFMKMRMHNFPGPRMPSEIWAGVDPAATIMPSVAAPAYQKLLAEDPETCGAVILAGRAVATPFVGAFLGALMATQIVARTAGLAVTPVVDINLAAL